MEFFLRFACLPLILFFFVSSDLYGVAGQPKDHSLGGNVDATSLTTSIETAISKVLAPSRGPTVPKRTYLTIIGIGKDEVLDYDSQKFTHFLIQPIEKGLQFKKNLSVDQYSLLLEGWLNSVYLNKFRNNIWALKYFSRCLAEYAYAYNGYVDRGFYSEIIERYDNYLLIDNKLKDLTIPTDIKYSLAKLYAAQCIYTATIDSSVHEIDKISKIPKDVILYYIQEQAFELFQEGEFSDTEAENKPEEDTELSKRELGSFAGYGHGENLYYICLAYSSNFKDLPNDKQLKIIEDIYLYNPTLMETPPIQRGRFAWSYLLDLIAPKHTPEVMKYSLKPDCNWVILPKTMQ